MTKTNKKSNYLKQLSREERDSPPGQHAWKAGVTFYKTEKRRLESVCEPGAWCEDDLKTLLYEMSTEESGY